MHRLPLFQSDMTHYVLLMMTYNDDGKNGIFHTIITMTIMTYNVMLMTYNVMLMTIYKHGGKNDRSIASNYPIMI